MKKMILKFNILAILMLFGISCGNNNNTNKIETNKTETTQNTTDNKSEKGKVLLVASSTNKLKLKNMTTYNIPKHLTGLSEKELKISQSKFGYNQADSIKKNTW